MNELKLFDESIKGRKYKYIIGVDEVGRGPLAGPVVACAVLIKNDLEIFSKVNDSKKISDKKRREIYDELINNEDIVYSIKSKDNSYIDKVNILNATLDAMKEAVYDLVDKLKLNDFIVLIDGNRLIKDFKYNQEAIVKGDSKSLSIAIASIIAKVYRDDMMILYHKEYFNYDFINNKGYGTKKHYEGLLKYGKTPIHRNSFLKKFLEKNDN